MTLPKLSNALYRTTFKQARLEWTKDVLQEVTGGRPYGPGYTRAEMAELGEALANLDPAGIKEELSDVAYGLNMKAHQATGLNLPMLGGYGSLEKFRRRNKVWKQVMEDHGLDYSTDHLVGGSNFHKPEKVRKAFSAAGWSPGTAEAKALSEHMRELEEEYKNPSLLTRMTTNVADDDDAPALPSLSDSLYRLSDLERGATVIPWAEEELRDGTGIEMMHEPLRPDKPHALLQSAVAHNYDLPGKPTFDFDLAKKEMVEDGYDVTKYNLSNLSQTLEEDYGLYISPAKIRKLRTLRALQDYIRQHTPYWDRKGRPVG